MNKYFTANEKMTTAFVKLIEAKNAIKSDEMNEFDLTLFNSIECLGAKLNALICSTHDKYDLHEIYKDLE